MNSSTLSLFLSLLFLGCSSADVADDTLPDPDELPDEDDCDDAPTELSIEFESIEIPGAAGATDFAFLPGGDEFLLTSRAGKLLRVSFDGEMLAVEKSWDFGDDVSTDQGCSPTNVLVDPDFVDNGFIYVSYCLTDLTVTRIVRYRYDPDRGIDQASTIFETTDGNPKEAWHRVGSIGFEPDGETMWIQLGDHFDPDRGQDVTDPEGALLRIVPNRDPDGEGHTYPEGNLHDTDPDAHPAIYAHGFRSPWRGTRDSAGRHFIGDVGLVEDEEVNLVTAVGQNFGWATHEGPCDSDCDDYVDPIAHYGRETDHPYVIEDPETEPATKRAIWVGQVYEDPAVDRYCGLMNDVVVFGDFFTGWVRALRVDGSDEVTLDRNIGHLPEVTQWRVGPDGFAYGLDIAGRLSRAVLVR